MTRADAYRGGDGTIVTRIHSARYLIFTHESVGAEGGTRTPTVLLPPAPQAGASANSATSARELYGCAGAGAAGAVVGAAGARPPTTDPGPRWPTMPSTSAPTMNRTASTVVARESTVAP